MLFISCSEVVGDHERSHLIREIPVHVDNALLQQLLNTGRVNFSDTVVFGRPCTFSVRPRTGLKQKQCREPSQNDAIAVVADGPIISQLMFIFMMAGSSKGL